MGDFGKRLWVLGATPGGIGEAVWERLVRRKNHWNRAAAYGKEDFDARSFDALTAELKNFRPTDVVFSVGINRLDWVTDVQLPDFREVFETNVWAFLNTMQALRLTSEGPVNVVAITSDAAWRPMRTSAVYCASKAALEMAVRVASREYAPYGWRINAVAPGKVEDTPMTDYVDDAVRTLRGWSQEFAENYERQSSPLGRKVTKVEVAEVVEHVLFGPTAQTGEIIAVNGGR